jgi:hypothetical protein
VRAATVTPDDLPQHLVGVSWLEPASIVVYAPGPWWRTRMTVAHELGHVLFDAPGMAISAARGPSRLYWLRQAIEQRASAFAAYLLVPPGGARSVLGGRAPTRAGLVEVARTYAVGLHVAANVMQNVWGLSDAEREGLLYGHDAVDSAGTHPDAVGPPSPGRQLRDRVERALARGVLGEVRAHALLGVPLSSPLPFGGHPPVLDALSRVRAVVTDHLAALGRPDLGVGEVLLHPSGYRVSLVSAWAAPHPRPHPMELHVTREFAVA